MPFKGESGVKITAKTGIDISSASVRRIYYAKPTGERGYWDATLESATSISYTTTSGDLNFTGTLKVQAYIVNETGEHYGTVAKIIVSGTLK